ncbi:alpha/beta-hydrolase [Periconia macrospinosa]|uniref:Alpha/beta-hydrolase n=1 Tax=Periconia macrospinosa TaxID=97972 RepID=A0A2V1D3F0_9PLEO|nr:alpha/beta-hydrolase [Periconia macrospinosa]
MLSLASIPLLSLLFADVHLANAADSTSKAPQPYKINVDPAFIEETRRKVANFRPSVELSGPAWAEGPPLEDITNIAKYWKESYNWSAVESKINSEFSQYTISLPPPGGNYDLPLEDIYFIHQRSNRSDAIPLLMLHGWPSTSHEWAAVIPELVNPANSSQPAFHVIAPDFPGFGFSKPARKAGLGPAEYGTLFSGLMRQLGYDEYAVYSTDLGYVIAQSMVVEYETKIINHITDFYLVIPSETDTARYNANQTTFEETAYISSMNAFFADHAGYSAIHSTLPLSIAYALNDSPLGFLAWMYQLFFTVNDSLSQPTPSDIITQALLLYIPGVYGNIRSYVELYSLENFAAKRKSSVPTSVLQHGSLLAYAELANFNYPREWVERNANVTFFARHDRGGHFPAVTVPDSVVGDIRESFKVLGY